MTIGRHDKDGLIAGDYPLKAGQMSITGPAEFKRGDVLALTNEGQPVLVNSAAAGNARLAVGIACDDVSVAENATGICTMFIKGEFNKRFLRFGGTDTADRHHRRMTEIGLLVRETRV